MAAISPAILLLGNEGKQEMAKYEIGKIKAANVAVGDNPYINVGAQQIPLQEDALRELRRFITLLPAQAAEIKKSHEVEENARAAEVALSKKRLDRGRIEGLIAKITAGVVGIAALTNAIDAVQAAVTRLFT
jgi:hypothetical protein